jgi:hypothetical protein
MRNIIILSAVVAAFGFGCAGDMAADPGDDEADVEVDGKADAYVLPMGDYEVITRTDGGMLDMTLNADKTFDRHMMVYCGVSNPNSSSGDDHGLDCGHQTGTYKFTKNSSGQHYIRFYDQDGNFISRTAYVYKPSQKIANMRNVDADAAKYSMKLSQPTDCRQDGCSEGTTCQICWANYACIPNGALC